MQKTPQQIAVEFINDVIPKLPDSIKINSPGCWDGNYRCALGSVGAAYNVDAQKDGGYETFAKRLAAKLNTNVVTLRSIEKGFDGINSRGVSNYNTYGECPQPDPFWVEVGQEIASLVRSGSK